MVTMTAALCRVTPSSVAFTKRASVPTAEPAMKVVERAVGVASDPREGRVKVHE
jgi:hypothetical protein